MSGNEDLKWIGCANCAMWAHYECVGKEITKGN
jgi:hypothetical protein